MIVDKKQAAARSVPRNFGDAFRLTFLTDNPRTAALADQSGIDRIGVDLEIIGKAERQDGRTSWVSHHTLEDLARVAPFVGRAELFVRVNPIHPQTSSEVEAVLRLGARALMLPYFRTADDADQFVRAVRGRAQAIVLIESAPSLTRIREVLAVPGIDE